MSKVFISYSRKDIDSAKRLTAALQKSELDFWIDWEGIPPTVDWWREIEKGIEEADIFVFLVSPDSAKSKVCGQEIDSAVKNAKRIIPLVVRDVSGDEAPRQLSHLNWIFFRENDDFNAALQKLLTAIHTDYEWVQNHRRLQVKALEWERNKKENSFLLRGKDLQEAELQLATNSSKDPHPTDLQREYIFTSRKATDRQRRITTLISITGIIALAILAVFGFYQAGQATNFAATAEANLVVAQTAQVDSQNNASTAVANEKEAKHQAEVAFSRQLAAQAQNFNLSLSSKQNLAVLMTIQSYKIQPSIEAANFLISDNLAAHTVFTATQDDAIYSVAFSPDDRYVATGGRDGIITVWDLKTGAKVGRIQQGEVVRVVTFSPEGKYIAGGSCDKFRIPETKSFCFEGSARVWELATSTEVARVTYDGEVIGIGYTSDGKYIVSANEYAIDRWDAMTGTIIKHENTVDRVNSIAVSSDNKFLIAGFQGFTNGVARVFDVGTLELIGEYYHADIVISVDINPRYDFIVSGGWDSSAIVRNTYTGQEISLVAHDGIVNSVAFSPDGRYVASGGDDYTARVWDAFTGIEISRMTHDAGVESVAFSHNGNYVASVDFGGNVRVWEANSGSIRSINEYSIPTIAFSPDSKYLASGGYDGLINVLDVETGKNIAHMRHDDRVNWIAFSPNGKYLASASRDATLRLWDAFTSEEVAKFFPGSWVESVAFSPNGKYIVSCSDNKVIVWDISTRTSIATMEHDAQVFIVTFSPDGKYVASASDDGTARIWDAFTGKEISRMNHDENSFVYSITFSPDGKYVASASDDGTARVWDAFTGKEISRMTKDALVIMVIFSPDGKYVASASVDGTARVWETNTGNEVAVFTHDGRVSWVSFSPDGKYLATSSLDATARVWEIAAGKEVARLTHDGYVWSARFSPDGKYVASSSDDRTARVWLWNPEDLIINACKNLPRNLTRAEWELYIGDMLPYQAICDNLPIGSEPTATSIATP